MSLQLLWVRLHPLLHVGDKTADLVEHLVYRALSPSERVPERPLQLVARLLRELIPAVVLLSDHPVIRELLQDGIDRPRRWPPPALGHPLDLVHELDPVLRGRCEHSDDRHAKPPLPVHHPSERPHPKFWVMGTWY